MKKLNIFLVLGIVFNIIFTPIALSYHNHTHHSHNFVVTNERYEEHTHECSTCTDLVLKSDVKATEFAKYEIIVTYEELELNTEKIVNKEHKTLVELNVKLSE